MRAAIGAASIRARNALLVVVNCDVPRVALKTGGRGFGVTVGNLGEEGKKKEEKKK